MKEINSMTGLNISVYHSFDDEVDSYRQHVWLCDGSCRKKPPFFGIVKRAKNMPPAPRDDWCMFQDSPNLRMLQGRNMRRLVAANSIRSLSPKAMSIRLRPPRKKQCLMRNRATSKQTSSSLRLIIRSKKKRKSCLYLLPIRRGPKRRLTQEIQ